MAGIVFLLLIPAPAGISQVLHRLQERKVGVPRMAWEWNIVLKASRGTPQRTALAMETLLGMTAGLGRNQLQTSGKGPGTEVMG